MEQQIALIDDINTPETLGVTPRYILQHNAISRSAHSLSATAKKLTAMAMALLPTDLSSLTAAFTFTDFCKALGYENGGKQYELFRVAVRECLQCIISIETEPDEKGKKNWKEFTWFTVAEYEERTGKATMKFSPELAEFLAALKWVYTKINLTDLGVLQSKYAIRIFEIIMSSFFLKGKQGNRENEWYFQADIADLRAMLGVPKEAYKETHLFKQKVIDGPVKEINAAGIGVEITPEGIKQGRNLKAIRLNCKHAAKKLPTRGRGRKKTDTTQPELSVITLKTGEQRQEKELGHLKEMYPQEFAALYQKELAAPHPFLGPENEFKKLAAEIAALKQLRERYGIVK